MRKMLHTTWILLLALAVTFALAACEEKKDEGETKKENTEEGAGAEGAGEEAGGEEAGGEEAGGEEAGGEEAGGEETAAAGPAEIEGLGLKANMPAGAEVSDMMGDKMIQAPDLVVTVGEANDMTPADLAAAKENADMYSPENLQELEVADGYGITFENTGGMGKNYWVQVYRKFGDKAYMCSTTASSEAQQKNAVDFCMSLSQ